VTFHTLSLSETP